MKTFNTMLLEHPVAKTYKISEYSETTISILIDLYDKQPIFIERLPYTEMFNALVSEFNTRTGSIWQLHAVYNLLLVLRKQGKLLPK